MYVITQHLISHSLKNIAATFLTCYVHNNSAKNIKPSRARLHQDFAWPVNSIAYLVVFDLRSKWPEVSTDKPPTCNLLGS